MRSVRFQSVLFGVGHLLGIDVTQDLNRDHAAAWTSFLNSRVRTGWEGWPFPELNLTEERPFRQVWYNDTPYLRTDPTNSGRPSELYYLPNRTYYAVNPAAVGDPPVGTLPTNAAYFTAIDLRTMEKYIAYDQPGKESIGLFYAAFAQDPRITRGFARRRWAHIPDENGIRILGGAGPTVWIVYQVRPSEFTSALYDNAQEYSRGDLAYDAVSGECFRALSPNTNVALSNTAVWQKQLLPYVLAEFVKYGAAADATSNAKTKASHENNAQLALSREIDKLIEQGAKFPSYRSARAGTRLVGPTAVVVVSS